MNLAISFKAISPVEVWPQPTVNLYAIAGRPAEMVLVVHRPDGQPLELSEFVSSRTGVTLEPTKVTAETADPPNARYGAVAGDWRIKVSLPDTDRPRSEAGTLRIKTNHPERPNLSLPMRIRVRPAIEAQPPRVELRGAAGGTEIVRTLTLRASDRQPFTITGVQLAPEVPGLVVRQKGPKRAGVQHVELRLDPAQLEPGLRTTQLIVLSDEKAAERMVVPVRIQLVEPAKSAAR